MHHACASRNNSNTTRPCDRFDRMAIVPLRRFFNILGLKTLWTLSDGELHAVAFLESLVSIADYGRIVDKDIPARRPLNKSKPLFIVEPLYLPQLFAHCPQTPLYITLQLQHATKFKQSGIILETHGLSTFKRINRLGERGSVGAHPAHRAETRAGRGIQANTTLPAVTDRRYSISMQS